jgi:hypothetical protein
MFFFSGDGVFVCDCGLKSPDRAEFMARIPKSTWCLVDSNRGLITVPFFLTALGLFIVQASSPRSNRIDWTNKTSKPVMRFFMKPWDLIELLVG